MLLIGLLAVVACAAARDTPTSADCSELYFEQNIDHFNWDAPLGGHTTFMQRYFVCNKSWTGGSVFFYFGNEDDVTLYVNHTGLMWENAESFGALLIFAEHRLLL